MWSDHFSKWPFERDLLNADKVFVKIMSSVKKYLKLMIEMQQACKAFSFTVILKAVFSVYLMKGAVTPVILPSGRAENYSSLF